MFRGKKDSYLYSLFYKRREISHCLTLNVILKRRGHSRGVLISLLNEGLGSLLLTELGTRCSHLTISVFLRSATEPFIFVSCQKIGADISTRTVQCRYYLCYGKTT